MNRIASFLQALHINYHNLDLYLEAFTHPSFNNEHPYKKNYQRLEFLGDAVLANHVSIFLFNNFPLANECQMSLLRSRFVKKEALARVASRLKFYQCIRLGRSNSQVNDSMLGDVFEAFIGAMHVDQGAYEVEKFLTSNLFNDIHAASTLNHKNPKTILQEYLQSESRDHIHYEVTRVNKGFQACVFHDHNLFGTGMGTTKKKAEVAAAVDALASLGVAGEAN